MIATIKHPSGGTSGLRPRAPSRGSRWHIRSSIEALLLLSIAAVASGCASAPHSPRGPAVTAGTADRAVSYALTMVGKPYRYGGINPEQGFDCSGLVQWSYGRAGLRLPRTPQALVQFSTPVTNRDLRRGDLLFFTQLEKKSSHIGIYLGDGSFVHAPRTGKNVEVVGYSDYWKRHLDEIRRPVTD